MGRLLSERKALLIEITEDTTQPDAARRAGSIELSVIESILGKLAPASADEARGGGRTRKTFPPHINCPART